MGADNPYAGPSRGSLSKRQGSPGPWLTFANAIPMAIAVVLLVVAVRYGYWTLQNYLYQGLMHPQGSMMTLATLSGSMAWLSTAACWRRHERVAGWTLASAGVACLVWILMLT